MRGKMKKKTPPKKLTIMLSQIRDTGMSQYELSKRLGISEGHMSKLFRGKIVPNMITWEKIQLVYESTR